ncbi:MAG TPA: dihydropteroate synthase [Nitrospirales bacterium]|nr:dihydropteroate synthase [Nitrospirales bacterium]HIO22123.1 dihydropteroate synthase [Nitrospirales bacterium]
MHIVGKELCLENRGLVMGILNVTPDSFSDGGQHLSTAAAVARAIELEEEGADVIDIGGESTRPGVVPTSLEEECRRVLPVIEQVAKRTSLPLSIDTSKAEVAKRALGAGVSIINDVTALRGDPEMASVVAQSGAGIILMHMQGTPRDMQDSPLYLSLLNEVGEFFRVQIALAHEAGIHRDQILLDPGIGFGKTLAHNLTLLHHLKDFLDLGHPLVIGPSRKSFLGQILQRPVDQRLMGTAAAVAIAIIHGATIVRVHDVAEMVQVVRVAQAIRDGNSSAVPIHATQTRNAALATIATADRGR